MVSYQMIGMITVKSRVCFKKVFSNFCLLHLKIILPRMIHLMFSVLLGLYIPVFSWGTFYLTISFAFIGDVYCISKYMLSVKGIFLF